MQGTPKINYFECLKSGYHFGEALNIVCLEPGCLNKALCCGACVEEDHKKHSTKPLKMVILEANENVQKIKPIELNTDLITELMLNHQKATLQLFASSKAKVTEYFETIEKNINSYYIGIIEQVKIKGSKSKHDITKIFQDFYKSKQIETTLINVQKIISLLPKTQTAETQIQEAQVMNSIQTTNTKVSELIQRALQEVTTSLQTNSTTFSKYVSDIDIWSKVNYTFSSKFKHPQITIVSPNHVKSGPSSKYKFIVMEPELQKGATIKRMAFKIKQSTSNWIAIGVCHKNIIVNKAYSFTFNTLGHGAYMISSNGGSWSNTQSQFNNTVKAFKFVKNDIIMMEFNQQKKKLKFKKKNQIDAYDLDYATINGDPLHPCVLFYYANDEIEYLSDFKEWAN